MDCSSGVCGSDPPGIVRRDGRAWLVGTPYSVDDVVEAQERYRTPAALARALGLTLHQVRMAEAWWEMHGRGVGAERAR